MIPIQALLFYIPGFENYRQPHIRSLVRALIVNHKLLFENQKDITISIRHKKQQKTLHIICNLHYILLQYIVFIITFVAYRVLSTETSLPTI